MRTWYRTWHGAWFGAWFGVPDRRARVGVSGSGCQKRSARFGVPESECQGRSARVGVHGSKCQVGSARFGVPGSECQVWSARFGEQGSVCQVRSARFCLRFSWQGQKKHTPQNDSQVSRVRKGTRLRTTARSQDATLRRKCRRGNQRHTHKWIRPGNRPRARRQT